MGKLVSTVFKTIAISIIMMIVMETAITVYDTLVVYNRMSAITINMQTELARNNCIPNATKSVFENQIKQVVNNSYVAIDSISNIDKNIRLQGKNYTAVNEAHVKNYGQIQTLAVGIKLSPTQIYFTTQKGTANEHQEFFGAQKYTYVVQFVYQVPCLRYLK